MLQSPRPSLPLPEKNVYTTAYTICKLAILNGLRLHSFHGTFQALASPMNCAVAAGCNFVAKSQPLFGHRAGTETRFDLNTHPGIFC